MAIYFGNLNMEFTVSSEILKSLKMKVLYFSENVSNHFSQKFAKLPENLSLANAAKKNQKLFIKNRMLFRIFQYF